MDTYYTLRALAYAVDGSAFDAECEAAFIRDNDLRKWVFEKVHTISEALA